MWRIHSSFSLVRDVILGHVVSRTSCHNPVYFIRRSSHLFYKYNCPISGPPLIGQEVQTSCYKQVLILYTWNACFPVHVEAITFCHMVTQFVNFSHSFPYDHYFHYTVKNLLECEDQSRFKVQAVQWGVIAYRLRCLLVPSWVRLPQVLDHWPSSTSCRLHPHRWKNCLDVVLMGIFVVYLKIEAKGSTETSAPT
jgi:hypothetical protein